MAETLNTYLWLGWDHIVSADALDHQLFLLALIWPFPLREYRKLLILITAFTIGHSITLALSSTGNIRIPVSAIEFLIPVSIFVTAIMQWWRDEEPGRFPVLFGITGIFGLLHGLGFANTLKQLLGREDSVFLPLLGFNLGVELGQLLLMLLLFGVKSVLFHFLHERGNIISRLVLALIMIGSAWMIWQRMPI